LTRKIVRFVANSKLYYDFLDKKLHDGDGVVDAKNFGRYEQQLLELLVDNAGKPFSRDEILDQIKPNHEEIALESKTVDNHVLNLRKNIDHRLNAKIIETVWKVGYRYVGRPCITVQGKNHVEQIPLPHVLTKVSASFVDKNLIIHREQEIYELEGMLEKNKAVLLVNGFGGIGKTSLARMLYARVADKYDSIGWVEYHGNLKDSLLAALELNDDMTDPEQRWQTISAHLKNDLSNKILFIDNVDYDIRQLQNPQNDRALQEITGWQNLTIVLTSRLEEIPCYKVYPVNLLGNEAKPEPCMDLFYFYYSKEEFEKPHSERRETEAVAELISLAGFHTYAIELLARSAVYEDTLSEYLKKIKDIGFKFPDLEIMTGHNDGSATAAGQLRLLFNMHSRAEREQQILWDFSVLPEGMPLTLAEVKELLAYSQNDLHRICLDSWLRHETGRGFFLHPLVREIIHFDLQEGKAPIGTVSRIVDLTRNHQLISAHMPQTEVLRRLDILENISKYIVFPSTNEEADFYYSIGITEYTYARRRLTSIAYLERSIQIYRSIEESGVSVDPDRLAEAFYQLGYIKSTTQKYRAEAKHNLRDALAIWNDLEDHEFKIAMAHDHLGYVLSDDAETYPEAQDHLRVALKMRRDFLNQNMSLENRRAYATTCDNLGFLLSKSDFDPNLASQLLHEALSVREQVYSETSQYETDVAWTAFNLAKHLSKYSENVMEAEMLLKRALEIREEQENAHPNMYIANIVFTLVALAKLISAIPGRTDEVRALTNRALKLKDKIDPEHTGYFSKEVETDIAELLRITLLN